MGRREGGRERKREEKGTRKRAERGLKAFRSGSQESVNG